MPDSPEFDAALSASATLRNAQRMQVLLPEMVEHLAKLAVCEDLDEDGRYLVEPGTKAVIAKLFLAHTAAADIVKQKLGIKGPQKVENHNHLTLNFPTDAQMRSLSEPEQRVWLDIKRRTVAGLPLTDVEAEPA